MSAAITPGEFDFIRQFLLQRSAIALDAGKEYLVEARVVPVLRKYKLTTIGELVALLRSPSGGAAERDLVDALTTNETYFFRDIHPFNALRLTVLPSLIQKRTATRRLNIWCAASSTGQEPYTIAMILREYFPALRGWDVRILATDLANHVLARAIEGKYNQIEVNRGLPAPLLLKYFKQEGPWWQISEELRKMITFRKLNLAEAWSVPPPVDLVFIRNVLIYFNVEMKKNILERIKRLLAPDGYLFLGSAETTVNLESAFKAVHINNTNCYQLG